MDRHNASGIEYDVVVNAEEQYSIWPTHGVLPLGWRKVKTAMDKQACLQFIESVWTDMRPLSMRQQLVVKNTPVIDLDTV